MSVFSSNFFESFFFELSSVERRVCFVHLIATYEGRLKNIKIYLDTVVRIVTSCGQLALGTLLLRTRRKTGQQQLSREQHQAKTLVEAAALEAGLGRGS